MFQHAHRRRKVPTSPTLQQQKRNQQKRKRKSKFSLLNIKIEDEHCIIPTIQVKRMYDGCVPLLSFKSSMNICFSFSFFFFFFLFSGKVLPRMSKKVDCIYEYKKFLTKMNRVKTWTDLCFREHGFATFGHISKIHEYCCNSVSTPSYINLVGKVIIVWVIFLPRLIS